MDTEFVLRWDMYGTDTFVSFAARQTESGYLMVVTRDGDTFLLSDTAADAETLFQKSEQLRRAFEGMGYLPKPGAHRETHMAGGVCWGPGAPVRPLVLRALTEQAAKAPSLGAHASSMA
jgi:hypothetical protein